MSDAMRRVLVTGASGEIGHAIAIALADDGFDVALHYRRNHDKARELERSIVARGGRAQTLGFDVADRAATAAALEGDMTARGAYWGVVLNAGITADNTFPALSPADWDSVLRVDLDAFYNVLHPLIMPLLRLRAGGRIVTMASAAGVVGNRGQTNYSAAKAGLIGATKALALDVAGRGVTVNCVAPGLIDTAMLRTAPVAEIQKQIPLARLGRPEEVAALVRFLFTDGAAYITRQVLQVNGGLV